MKEITRYNNIEELCTSSSHIRQVRNRKCQARACMTMALGFLLILLPCVTHLGSDLAAMQLLTLGLFLALGALAQWLKGTHLLMYLPTGQEIVHGTATYDHTSTPALLDLMEEGVPPTGCASISTKPNGGIQVEYLFTHDLQMLAIGARRFENMMWCPLSPHVVLYTGNEAEQAIKALGIKS